MVLNGRIFVDSKPWPCLGGGWCANVQEQDLKVQQSATLKNCECISLNYHVLSLNCFKREAPTQALLHSAKSFQRNGRKLLEALVWWWFRNSQRQCCKVVRICLCDCVKLYVRPKHLYNNASGARISCQGPEVSPSLVFPWR